MLIEAARKWPVDSMITKLGLLLKILRESMDGLTDCIAMQPRGRSDCVVQRSVTGTARVCLRRDTDEGELLPLSTEMTYGAVGQKEARPAEWTVEEKLGSQRDLGLCTS